MSNIKTNRTSNNQAAIVCVPFRYKMQRVRDLLNIVKTFTWSDTPSSDRKTKAALISRVQRLALRTHITVAVSHTSYLILRIVTKSKNTLFFNTWVPFEEESNVAYVIILIIQVDSDVVWLTLVNKFYGFSIANTTCNTKFCLRKSLLHDTGILKSSAYVIYHMV